MQLDVMAERRGCIVQRRVDVTGDRVERWEPAPFEVFARRLEMLGRDDVRRVMELWWCKRKARGVMRKGHVSLTLPDRRAARRSALPLHPWIVRRVGVHGRTAVIDRFAA
jgi:hypothetical protein